MLCTGNPGIQRTPGPSINLRDVNALRSSFPQLLVRQNKQGLGLGACKGFGDGRLATSDVRAFEDSGLRSTV